VGIKEKYKKNNDISYAQKALVESLVAVSTRQKESKNQCDSFSYLKSCGMKKFVLILEFNRAEHVFSCVFFQIRMR
jgi:hypothetical protein